MYKLIFSSIIFCLISTSSFAYLGPGVGGGVIAATIGVVVAIIAALFGLIWFPIKRLLKKKKIEKENQQNKVD
jgi:ABC-type antimicrobial peptide transport system permease subunit